MNCAILLSTLLGKQMIKLLTVDGEMRDIELQTNISSIDFRHLFPYINRASLVSAMTNIVRGIID